MAFGLVGFLLAVYVPVTAVLGPTASPVAVVGAVREPTSTIAALPTYSRQVVPIDYVSNGTAGLSGVFWTELWYERGDGAWTLYAPPWNPSGRWSGEPVNSPLYAEVGTILFDTFYTGGDARYNFTTVAVDRGFYREIGPSPADSSPSAGHAKARTIVDSTPPNVFVARPALDAWTNVDTLAWSAEDAVSGIASVNVSVDGGPVTSYTQASSSTVMALSGPGGHNVTLTATDGAGNPNTVTVPFFYNPNGPSIAITSPAANSYVGSSDVDVAWTVGNDLSGIASLRLTVDSTPAVTLPADATSYHLAGLAQSGHVLGLVAVDNAGNVASQTLSFGVDTTPPTVSLASPVDGGYVAAHQIQALWSASDATSGIAQVLVSLDGGTAVPIVNAAAYTFADVAEGSHTVVVRAVDRAGNAASAGATVTVDATPPLVTITSPAGGADLSGSVSVNWSASDALSGVAQVLLVVDGGTPTLAGRAQVS